MGWTCLPHSLAYQLFLYLGTTFPPWPFHRTMGHCCRVIFRLATGVYWVASWLAGSFDWLLRSTHQFLWFPNPFSLVSDVPWLARYVNSLSILGETRQKEISQAALKRLEKQDTHFILYFSCGRNQRLKESFSALSWPTLGTRWYE